jgi:hypothetical protein
MQCKDRGGGSGSGGWMDGLQHSGRGACEKPARSHKPPSHSLLSSRGGLCALVPRLARAETGANRPLALFLH